MSRQGFVLAAAYLALAACARAPGDPLAQLSAGAARGHNLLVITLDTTRADHLGSYGYAGAATPHLDRLAVSGLRFEHALTTAPVTLPAHSTIFTGLEPPHHGVRNNAEFTLRDDASTLAEVLGGAGYDTAAFVSSFVLDARYGLAQGFAHYDDHVDPPPTSGFAAGVLERSAARTVDAAIGWLEARRSEKPFFLWVHLFDPHAPYLPPEPFATRFADRLYDGEIAAMDAAIGRLLEATARLGVDEQTVVLALGDHGEGLGDHGERTHAFFVYDSVMRVPLLLSAPGVVREPGVVRDCIVSTADLTPTLLSLLGVADPAKRDGLDLLTTRTDPTRTVYLESLPPWLDYGWAPLYALRSRDEKVILAPRPERYDLEHDAGELRDLLAGKSGGDAVALLARLRERVAGDLASPAGTTGTTAVDSELRGQLQALGYLSGAGPAEGAEGSQALDDPKDRVGIANALVDANALAATGRVAEAIAAAEAAYRLSPRDRSALQALGKLYLRAGRIREADRAFRAFSEIRPKADVSLLLGQIALLDGKIEESGRWLEQARDLEPKHGGVYIALGDLALRQGRAASAAELYTKAIEVDPYRASSAARGRLSALRKGENILPPR